MIVKECSSYSENSVSCNPDQKIMRPSRNWSEIDGIVTWDLGVSQEAKNLNFFSEFYELEILTNFKTSNLRPFFEKFKLPKIKVLKIFLALFSRSF